MGEVFRVLMRFSGVFRRGIQGIQEVFRVFRPRILGFSAGNPGGTSPRGLWYIGISDTSEGGRRALIKAMGRLPYRTSIGQV